LREKRISRIFATKIAKKIKIFRSCYKSDADDAETNFCTLSTVPASVQPELHAVKVLVYAESVSVVTSGHVAKMAVTPFDPQLPQTPCYTQT